MKKFLRKLKREAMPFFILFIVFDIVVMGAFNYAISKTPKDDFTALVSNLMEGIKLKFFIGIFTDFVGFINLTIWTFAAFVVMFIAWKIKNMKNSEYQDIENGSSDWSKDGEEFDKLEDGSEVLNKKGGFILSKKHYLGTDLKKVKINKNVLVIGRIRFR